MARASSTAQQRTLSLTEELEKLEQSITLTLQEIDHNFSKAHRIVTSSILPIVEQYASHSRDVWEGSKFWKQFFESSANVSLSGYEEQFSQHENAEESLTEESNTATHTTLEESSHSYETPSAQHISTTSIQDLDLSSLTISPSHSTPRPTKKEVQPTFADYPSPYEALRQEVNNTTNFDATSISHTNNLPETPGRRNISDDVAMTPQSSPMLPRYPTSAVRPNTAQKKNDPLLHRVLDKTYRIQATPLASNRRDNYRQTTTPGTTNQTRNHLLESTLSSSPEVAPPKLHAEIFSSPRRRRSDVAPQRTPGVSVLTPARKKTDQASTRALGIWDSDDEDEFDSQTGVPFGASPPKTMQFHIPQSKLLKTPAKEASRRIVDDILETAGISRDSQDDSDEFDIDVDVDLDADDYDNGLDENSPSVVRKVVGLEDETF